MNKSIICNLILLFLFAGYSHAKPFPLVNGKGTATIYYDPLGSSLDSITAHLFAADVALVTGKKPKVITDISRSEGPLVIIGNINSPVISALVDTTAAFFRALNGQWERFGYTLLRDPFPKVREALVIAGSDPRGTAFGVFSLSERCGVSPWYWWADVHPEKKKTLFPDIESFVSATPSVQYRGIFINDEDWGLQPWAAKTFEPETGDIGPKTYTKVFELLLRLKANMIWPAMHPSTKSFFHYPGNRRTAEAYHIVVGSSHAEPMLRNNVDEWDSKTMGAFNYLTNSKTVLDYWAKRVQETSTQDAIFTLGMRGVHDSGMEGIKNPKDAVPVLTEIIRQQRAMLANSRKEPLSRIPQTFTIYKEVLDIYDSGLTLPEDVTITWPDDNYGYIQRLNDNSEKQRPGGSGVYYHASYWGRPHDYLWLSSTHPALIRAEMMKAFENGSNRIWVLNVGDIKPLEYNISLFMDMAYRAGDFTHGSSVKTHLKEWSKNIFGAQNATTMQDIFYEYYQLAFERRPEFMGWSQTEPTTQVNLTAYNHFYFGDQAAKRVQRYEQLEKRLQEVRSKIPAHRKDAFYQLAEYPAVCAANINRKFIYRDKALLYQAQHRTSASYYAALSMQAHESIQKETIYFNQKLSNGKWNGIMHFQPRNLPVFNAPEIPLDNASGARAWNIALEGIQTAGNATQLPLFSVWGKEKYFMDIFLCGSKQIAWEITAEAPWITVSERKGELRPEAGASEKRIWISVDWKKAPKTQTFRSHITVKSADTSFHLLVSGVWENTPKTIFKESAGYISMPAYDFSSAQNTPVQQWRVTEGPGHTGNTLLASGNPFTVQEFSSEKTAWLQYDFYNQTETPGTLFIHTIPTHPLTKATGMRYAVSINGAAPVVQNFQTVGRSEEWKQNVLRNSAVKKLALPPLKKGRHSIKIYMIDPGVFLDRIEVIFQDGLKGYGVLPFSPK
ncbi:MAG: glycosyl hydrolase 115 family protein [Chitinophagaceae bacterium]